MDPEDFRTILHATGADLWDLIDGALSFAALHHPRELQSRRDHIIEHVDSLTTEALGKTPAQLDITVDVADVVKDPTSSPEAEKETFPEGSNVDDANYDKLRCNILAIKMYLDEPEEVS